MKIAFRLGYSDVGVLGAPDDQDAASGSYGARRLIAWSLGYGSVKLGLNWVRFFVGITQRHDNQMIDMYRVI